MTDETLTQLFDRSVKAHSKRPALRWKQGERWRDWTYKELDEKVSAFANGLLALGLEPGDRLAIFSKNNPQWAVADWASVTHGFVTVPIYDTLTEEAAAYILNDSDARVVVVQTEDHLNKIRKVRKKVPKLRHVVVIQELFEKSLQPGEHLFDQVYALGKNLPKTRQGERAALKQKVKPESIASIVYTSGTTGEPKGALLTHGNFASNCSGALECVPIDPGYVSLSFLPLSHVFERMGGHFTMIKAGGTIAYAESIEKVPENLVEVRPHVVFSVPRLYEKLYARIQDQVRKGSFLKRYFFRKAVAVGEQYVHEKYDLKVENPATLRKWKKYDKLVFSKLKQRVGGRLEFFVSGGAPLSPEIHKFFTAAGLPILQGYGLTETSPVVAVNRLTAMRIGSVGPPISAAEIQIAEDGEILVRGPMVFKGYHGKREATKEVFTDDGFFRTGDIGHLDEDGFLFITDRKKELIILSNGKNVAPQPIENALKTKRGIAQAVIIGNNRPFISALLAPDFEALSDYAKDNGIAGSAPEVLVKHPKVRELFDQHVREVNETLNRYEQVKKYDVLAAELTQESGELTPTLKIKRRVVDEKYAPVIAGLYNGAKPHAVATSTS